MSHCRLEEELKVVTEERSSLSVRASDVQSVSDRHAVELRDARAKIEELTTHVQTFSFLTVFVD
jgi:hypothetical protein